jgi:hypothetical protein
LVHVAAVAGRIRTIKPEWRTDEKLKAASDEARVLSATLITLADDYGNGEAGDLAIAGATWSTLEPREALAKSSRAIRELLAIGYVLVYEVCGSKYFNLPHWKRHQKVDHPGKPLFPGPERADKISEITTETVSRQSREDFANDSRQSRECLAPDQDQDQYQYQDPSLSKAPTDHATHDRSRKARTSAAPNGAAVTKSVIDFFNEQSKRTLSPATYRPLVERALKSGYTVREMKLVLWWALGEWGEDPDMAKYAHPNTLLPLKKPAGRRAFPQYLDLAREHYRKVEGHDFDRDPKPEKSPEGPTEPDAAV